jgi:S1-C subfamily serine protease
MRQLQVGVLCVALAMASYATAAPPEGRLGRTLGAPSGKTPAPDRAASAAAIGEGLAGAEGAPRAYGKALSGLQPEGRSLTRGAKETQVYQQASPAVVLIVTGDAIGSGVLIDADGRIVTNLHVVEGAKEVGVIFKPRVEGASVADAAVHRAKVLRVDEVADLALIQVSEIPGHVKPLAIAKNPAVSVGADVHAIGHPTGQSWTYTRGIVSQIRRDYAWSTESRLKHQATVIQTQTPINPGNSGGPLLDDNLQVIGINSFVSDGEGLNFAVSAEDVNSFLARTGDRRTTPVEKPKDCKSVAVDERPLKDIKGTEYLMDSDCDGKGDYQLEVPDSKKEPIVVSMDDDGDGKIDTLIFDDGHDGKPDLAMYDTDGNGKLDMKGLYRRGEDEPYRYEKIKE